MILNTRDGKNIEAEIICTFSIEKFSGQYVIYKADDMYYGAKYVDKDNATELITDLSKEEQDALNNMFLQYRKEGDLNA